MPQAHLYADGGEIVKAEEYEHGGGLDGESQLKVPPDHHGSVLDGGQQLPRALPIRVRWGTCWGGGERGQKTEEHKGMMRSP